MEREESTKLELRDVFKPIKRNFGIILILVVTIVGTSTFLTWTADKIYEASALLSIQEASGAQNKLLEIPSVLHQKYVVQNQVAVLESRTLAASVIKHLLNSSYRDSLKILQRRGPKNRIPFISRILKQKKRENLPPLSFRKMVERFRKATKVSYGQETNIIELKARSSIPWEAAVLVNTWVKVYQEYTRSGTKDEVTQTRNFLEKKLKEYEQKLTRSEQELASYQRKNKVVALPQESEQIVKQLANFHYSYNSTITELQSVQEQLEYLKNQLDENRKNLVKDMSSMSSPVLGKLQEEMASLVSKKAAFEAQLIGAGIDPSTNNKLKEMESRIQGIRQKIISETKKLVESGLDNINPLGRSEDLITKILSLETDYKALKAKANAQKRVVDEYTKLGLIDPYSSGSHLDIRYCIESAFNDRVTYKNALNPGAILAGTNYNTTPELVYDDGSQYGSIIENGYSFPIETDENGFFIKIGARVEDDALDFDEIYIIMMKIFYIIHMIYLIHHLYTMDTITMQ